ncbi:MAG: hypothetical protein EPN17_14115 [Methylobacter sp.]|nr:MAG: hypothetical protein EPN17_14115 [Methylobacter sp.]
MTEVTEMKIRTLMRNSALTRARCADFRCPFAKNWRSPIALLLVFGVTLFTFVTPSAAQNLPEPTPYCVSCGAGYHCVHNPEGCEPDASPTPKPPLQQPSISKSKSKSKSDADTCPDNAELWAGGTLCRCVSGYIENKGSCVALGLGTAKVRALELKSIEKASECRAMAQILNEFSRAVGFNSEQLASYAGKVLSNGVVLQEYGISHTLVPPASANYAVSFFDTGFRPQYKQPENNQVRHFVAYFVVGLSYGNGILGDPTYTALLAELRDKGEQADIDLGNVAVALGRQAAGAPHMMENIGTSIRSQVCN